EICRGTRRRCGRCSRRAVSDSRNCWRRGRRTFAIMPCALRRTRFQETRRRHDRAGLPPAPGSDCIWPPQAVEWPATVACSDNSLAEPRETSVRLRSFVSFVVGGLLGVAAGFAIGIFSYPYIFLADIVASDEVDDAAQR